MPILIFLLIENQDPIAMRGVAIPVATDSRLFVGCIGAIRQERCLLHSKLFLMALAVVDDIAGILVIAIFYTDGISWFAHWGSVFLPF